MNSALPRNHSKSRNYCLTLPGNKKSQLKLNIIRISLMARGRNKLAAGSWQQAVGSRQLARVDLKFLTLIHTNFYRKTISQLLFYNKYFT